MGFAQLNFLAAVNTCHFKSGLAPLQAPGLLHQKQKGDGQQHGMNSFCVLAAVSLQNERTVMSQFEQWLSKVVERATVTSPMCF